MTKHPQSKIGYYVNGVCVRKPPLLNRNIATAGNTTVTSRERRRKDQQQVASEYRCAVSRRKQAFSKRNMIRKLNQEFEGVEESIICLKNFSKVGHMKASWKILNDLLKDNAELASDACKACVSKSGASSHRNFLTSVYTKLVHVLFTNDVEERASIYYAALTGRDYVVRWYLSMYLCTRFATWGVHKAVQHEKLKGRKKMNFCEWLDIYGFSPGVDFQQEDFDMCVKNALNKEVRDVFGFTKYSFENILSFAMPSLVADYRIIDRIAHMLTGWLETEYLNARSSNLSQQTKARRLPKLFHIDDEADYDDVSASDYFEQDVYLEECTRCDNEVSLNADIDDYDKNVSGVDEGEHYEDMSSWAGVDDKSLSACISSCFEDLDGDIGSDDNDASSLPLEMKGATVSTCTEWEMLSDVASVRSVKSNSTTAPVNDSDVKTYRDAILKRVSNASYDQSNSFYPIPGRHRKEQMVKFVASDCSDGGFDYDFEYKCRKGQRGGKESNMFKGEPKTCKKWRRDNWL